MKAIRETDMTAFLSKAKLQAYNWADTLISTLPFLIAVSVDNRRHWQDQATKKAFTLPFEPGIYLVYPLSEKTPVYIGASSNLRRRLTYQFADSASSHKESTLKKNLYRDELWDGKTPIEKCFRFRYFTIVFGRTEIEKHLHENYQINTGRSNA
jgi:hypothetical protein